MLCVDLLALLDFRRSYGTHNISGNMSMICNHASLHVHDGEISGFVWNRERNSLFRQIWEKPYIRLVSDINICIYWTHEDSSTHVKTKTFNSLLAIENMTNTVHIREVIRSKEHSITENILTNIFDWCYPRILQLLSSMLSQRHHFFSINNENI